VIVRALIALLALASGAAHAAEPPPPLRIGAVGYIKADTRNSVAPVLKYLEKGLARPIRLTMYRGYNDAIVEIAAGHLDLAILPPIVHLHVHDTLGTRPLGYGIYPTGQFSYKAVILARKDDKSVTSLKDLKGKPVGFVDLFSASGYVYPKLMLAEAGIDAKSVQDRFFGNHLDALKALDAGQVAAAATYELVFQEAKTPIKPMSEYTLLASSDPIPSEALVATKNLDPAVADKVKDLLLSFYARREEDPAYAGGLYLGFIPPDPSVLTGIRSAYHRVVPEAAEATR
jgi:phosphonate transport system substrate-binding protein